MGGVWWCVVVVVLGVCVCVCVCVCGARARTTDDPPPPFAIKWLQQLHEGDSLTISGLLSPYFRRKPSPSPPPAPGLPFSNTSCCFLNTYTVSTTDSGTRHLSDVPLAK